MKTLSFRVYPHHIDMKAIKIDFFVNPNIWRRRWKHPLLNNRCLTNDSKSIPKRYEMVSKLEKGEKIDVLIVGGGCTGSGVALDASLRGLKVVCIEREDFSSGTSSRSTKLLWGGSRYLVGALVSLLIQTYVL